jgi:hypothetical protein
LWKFYFGFYKCEKYYKTELAFYIQKQPMEEELKFSLGVNYHNDVVLALFIYLFILSYESDSHFPTSVIILHIFGSFCLFFISKSNRNLHQLICFE